MHAMMECQRPGAEEKKEAGQTLMTKYMYAVLFVNVDDSDLFLRVTGSGKVNAMVEFQKFQIYGKQNMRLS